MLSSPSMGIRFDATINNSVRHAFMCWYQSDSWTINWRGTYLLAYFDHYRDKRMDNGSQNWHLPCDGCSTNSNWIAERNLFLLNCDHCQRRFQRERLLPFVSSARAIYRPRNCKCHLATNQYLIFAAHSDVMVFLSSFHLLCSLRLFPKLSNFCARTKRRKSYFRIASLCITTNWTRCHVWLHPQWHNTLLKGG